VEILKTNCTAGQLAQHLRSS